MRSKGILTMGTAFPLEMTTGVYVSVIMLKVLLVCKQDTQQTACGNFIKMQLGCSWGPK